MPQKNKVASKTEVRGVLSPVTVSDENGKLRADAIARQMDWLIKADANGIDAREATGEAQPTFGRTNGRRRQRWFKRRRPEVAALGLGNQSRIDGATQIAWPQSGDLIFIYRDMAGEVHGA